MRFNLNSPFLHITRLKRLQISFIIDPPNYTGYFQYRNNMDARALESVPPPIAPPSPPKQPPRLKRLQISFIIDPPNYLGYFLYRNQMDAGDALETEPPTSHHQPLRRPRGVMCSNQELHITAHNSKRDVRVRGGHRQFRKYGQDHRAGKTGL